MIHVSIPAAALPSDLKSRFSSSDTRAGSPISLSLAGLERSQDNLRLICLIWNSRPWTRHWVQFSWVVSHLLCLSHVLNLFICHLSLLASRLFGVTSVQAFIYFRSAKGDTIVLKTVVSQKSEKSSLRASADFDRLRLHFYGMIVHLTGAPNFSCLRVL